MFARFKHNLKLILFFVFILSILVIVAATPAVAKEYEFTNYSVTGPIGSDWELWSIDKDKQEIIFNNQKKNAMITIMYQPILDPNSNMKAIADNSRDGEIAMMQNDPRTPVRKETVRYFEELIGGRNYYGMSYANATKLRNYGHLYFYISNDLKNTYAGHLNILENKKDEPELLYTFKNVLKTIIIHPVNPYEDAINRSRRLVGMFTIYAQQYDPKVHSEDIRKDLNGCYDLAMANTSKALELKPESADAHFLLGILYEFNDDMVRYGDNFPADKAISEYKKAIEIDPKYENAYFDLGVVDFNIGNTDEAILNYSKVVELNPTNNIASLYLYSAYEKKGMLKEAKETLEQAVKYWVGSKEDKREVETKIQELKKRLN